MTMYNNFNDFYFFAHFPFYSDSHSFFCCFFFISAVSFFLIHTLLCVRHLPYCYCYRFSRSLIFRCAVLLALDVLKLLVFIVIVCFIHLRLRMVFNRTKTFSPTTAEPTKYNTNTLGMSCSLHLAV